MFREREGIRRGEEKDTGGGLQWSDLLPGAGTHGEAKLCVWRERGEKEGGRNRHWKRSDLLLGAGTQSQGDEGLWSEREKG